MHRFFATLASASVGAFLFAWVVGRLLVGHTWTTGEHILLGLIVGFVTIAVHCLVFAIFTGSGKDARELVQRYGLNPEYITRIKAFRKELFPLAMYAILWTSLAMTLGGGIVLFGKVATVFRWAHLAITAYALFYNARVFALEYRRIKENSFLIDSVNAAAAQKSGFIARENEEESSVESMSAQEWGHSAFALGKFLIFLGWNVWLPYIYLRFIMGQRAIPFVPFLIGFCLLLAGGYYLRYAYRGFRPEASSIR